MGGNKLYSVYTFTNRDILQEPINIAFTDTNFIII